MSGLQLGKKGNWAKEYQWWLFHKRAESSAPPSEEAGGAAGLGGGGDAQAAAPVTATGSQPRLQHGRRGRAWLRPCPHPELMGFTVCREKRRGFSKGFVTPKAPVTEGGRRVPIYLYRSAEDRSWISKNKLIIIISNLFHFVVSINDTHVLNTYYVGSVSLYLLSFHLYNRR